MVFHMHRQTPALVYAPFKAINPVRTNKLKCNDSLPVTAPLTAHLLDSPEGACANFSYNEPAHQKEN